MSKIVILKAQLGAPQVIDDLLQRVAMKNSPMADWIRKLDTIPIIRECVENALNRLGEMEGIGRCKNITDFFGKAYNGKLDGALRTDKFPKGLGVKVTDQGAIEFVADDYTSGWKKEIKRLRGLFTDAFLAEITSSIGIDVDFRKWKADERGKSTSKAKAAVYELTKNGTFKQIFGSISSDAGKLRLTQAQIKGFVIKHRRWLRTYGYAIFFLFKSNNDFFVANVSVGSGGSLFVGVRRFDDGSGWDADLRHRVVILKLA